MGHWLRKQKNTERVNTKAGKEERGKMKRAEMESTRRNAIGKQTKILKLTLERKHRNDRIHVQTHGDRTRFCKHSIVSSVDVQNVTSPSLSIDTHYYASNVETVKNWTTILSPVGVFLSRWLLYCPSMAAQCPMVLKAVVGGTIRDCCYSCGLKCFRHTIPHRQDVGWSLCASRSVIHHFNRGDWWFSQR